MTLENPYVKKLHEAHRAKNWGLVEQLETKQREFIDAELFKLRTTVTTNVETVETLADQVTIEQNRKGNRSQLHKHYKKSIELSREIKKLYAKSREVNKIAREALIAKAPQQNKLL